MPNAFHYSIGRKLIQAISGAFLVLFLLLHSTINFFSVIDSFTGKFGAADGLFHQGCEFMALPIVSLMVPVLALGFLVHILYGCFITYKNVKARGGLKRYEAQSVAAADSWAAKNMFVLGIIILGILFFHLTHFWSKMQLQMFLGQPETDPYVLLTNTFGRWWSLLVYLIWFVAVWFHLVHGFWSMFQTVGWNSQVWFKRLKIVGIVVATLILLMFVAVACNGFLQAHSLI